MKFTEEPRDFAPHLPASKSCHNFLLPPIFANFFFLPPLPRLNNICRIIEKSTWSRDKCLNVPVYSWSAHDKLSIAPGTINLRKTLGHQREQRKIWKNAKYRIYGNSRNSPSQRWQIRHPSVANCSSNVPPLASPRRSPEDLASSLFHRFFTMTLRPWKFSCVHRGMKNFSSTRKIFLALAPRVPHLLSTFFTWKDEKKNLIHRYRR